MSAAASPGQQGATVGAPALSPWWLVVAAALVGCSSVAQLFASLQRWVVAGDSWTRVDHLVEDHLFDYSYPADPWEPVGAAAQLFGVGYLLLALGVLVMTFSAVRRPTRSTTTLGGIVAASFAIDGAHALVSGLAGFPSPVQYFQPVLLLFSVGAAVCLVILAVSRPRSWSFAIACLSLIGATIPGYLIAAFQITPALTGYQSYDTTPWTETVVAAATAAAAIALLIGAALSQLRVNQRRDPGGPA